MIVAMQRLRIIGPRVRAQEIVRALQDVGVLHPSRPEPGPPFARFNPGQRHRRHVLQVGAALDDVEEALVRLDAGASPSAPPARYRTESLAREVRLARRARRAAVAIEGARRACEDEIPRLQQTARALEVFAGMRELALGEAVRTFYLVLPDASDEAVTRLEQALAESLGDGFALHTHPIPPRELAIALTVPAREAARTEALLPDAGVRELALPQATAATEPAAALSALRERLTELELELVDIGRRRAQLTAWLLPGLLRARSAMNDWLLASQALEATAVSDYLFVVEGWLPESERESLEQALRHGFGEQLVVEERGREHWAARDAPVEIVNPRLIRPFELITRWLPLPHYGTIDATPFVAVFFPMFFGLMLGDLGYGATLGALALVGRAKSTEGSWLRSASEIAGACSIYAMIFGVFFGEFLGDLGHRLGMRAIAFSREDAFVPFLALALALGFVHVVLGLVLGALSGFRSEPRASFGRGLSAVMLVLTAAMLLAAINVLPEAFFNPAAIGLLVSFPLLIAIEGLLGPVELMSRVSNILSYARIMALGTASVMLAVVANQMVGTLGGAVVGVLFATLFHLVNFGLGVFSPTIHALRLHFVEFFGTFYSPGGLAYRPLRHWEPADATPVRNV